MDRATDLPGGLVFTDVAEYSPTDDLSGDPLDGQLVTIAKREEVTEVYRQAVWTEAPVADCFRHWQTADSRQVGIDEQRRQAPPQRPMQASG